MAKSRHGFTYLSDYKPPSYRVTIRNGSPDWAYRAWLIAKHGEQEGEVRMRMARAAPSASLIGAHQFKTEEEAIAYVESLARSPQAEAAD